MIIHQAKGMDQILILVDSLLQEEKELGAVPGIEKNALSAIASKHDMMNSAREVDAGLSGHGQKLKQELCLSSLTPTLFVKPDPDSVCQA